MSDILNASSVMRYICLGHSV